MNPDSFKIDSPTPYQAAADASRYLDFMRPSLIYGGVEYNLDEFRKLVASGDFLLIRVWDGEEMISVSAVRVRDLEDGRDLYIVATSSLRDINDWIDDFDKVLMELAGEAGCDTITVQTREGMGKISRRAGYKVHQVIIRKRVRTLQ